SKKEKLLVTVAQEAKARTQAEIDSSQRLDLERALDIQRRDLERAQAEFLELQTARQKRNQEVAATNQLRFGFEQEQGVLQQALEDLQAKLHQDECERIDGNQKIERDRSRLLVLEEFEKSYQGYRPGVRTVMEGRADRVRGILGEI